MKTLIVYKPSLGAIVSASSYSEVSDVHPIPESDHAILIVDTEFQDFSEYVVKMIDGEAVLVKRPDPPDDHYVWDYDNAVWKHPQDLDPRNYQYDRFEFARDHFRPQLVNGEDVFPLSAVETLRNSMFRRGVVRLTDEYGGEHEVDLATRENMLVDYSERQEAYTLTNNIVRQSLELLSDDDLRQLDLVPFYDGVYHMELSKIRGEG